MLIGGFQPFTLSDFPGKSASILFTQGCNFRCPYCHNRSLWPLFAKNPPTHSVGSVLEFMRQRQNFLGGLVLTGGEPTLQADLAVFLREIKRLGIAVKLDTNGSHPEILAGLLEKSLVDYIAMDIKAPLEKYDLLCGRPVDTDAIRRSIDIIGKSGVNHHFRTTLFRPLLSEDDQGRLRKLVPQHSKHLTQPCLDVEE